MKKNLNRKNFIRISMAVLLIAGGVAAFSMSNKKEGNGASQISLSYLTRIADANAETHCDQNVPQTCGGDGAGCQYWYNDPETGARLFAISQVCKQ